LIIQYPFSNIANVIDTLKKRIALSSCINNKVKSKTLVYRGDYTKANGICSTIEKAINSNSLNVIFIDPTDLSVPFSLYKELSKRLQKVDFVLNIATGTDLNRNIVKAFDERELPIRKKYEKALGSNLFFEDEKNRRLAQKNQSTLLTDAFLERLLLSFYEIGYPMHVEKRIRNYYQLIYLSQKSLGKKLWEVAVKRNASEADSRQGLLNLSGGNNG